MKTMITLVVKKHDMQQSFSVSHAERLLAIGFEKNGGWELPENSKFEYTKEGGIKRKRDKASARTSEQEERNN